MVERQPSKLNVAGSNPVSRSPTARGRFVEVEKSQSQCSDVAHLAQSVERVLGKDEVTSSILVIGSRLSSFVNSPRLRYVEREI